MTAGLPELVILTFGKACPKVFFVLMVFPSIFIVDVKIYMEGYNKIELSV